MDDVELVLPAPCDAPWAEMTEDGPGRFCNRCSTRVHDLENYTPPELEALLQTPGKVCVRARLNRSGEIALRTGSAGSLKRFVATVGGSIALMSSSTLAAAKPGPPEGAIAGTVTNSDWATLATATSTDGKIYAAKVKANGRFKIKHLPPGIYQLSYTSACADPWPGEVIVVEPGKTATTHTEEFDGCIVVGVIEFRRNDG